MLTIPEADLGAEKPDFIRIDKPHILLVEGYEDKKFFTEFVESLDSKEQVQAGMILIIKAGIRKELERTLKKIEASTDYFRNREIKSIGIIQDAEENEAGARQSVCRALWSVNLSANREKQVPVPGKPKTEILILPGDGQRGCLETVCLSSNQDDSRMACVKVFSDCVKREWATRFAKDDETEWRPLKARLAKMTTHAFLSTYYKKPEIGLGDSFRRGDVWNLDHPAFETIKEFLTDLCAAP